MGKTVYLVSGNKGGTGKSFFCLSLIEYLRSKNVSFSMIETDDGNPDIALTYTPLGLDVQNIDLLMAEDPLDDLVNAINGAKNDFIVISAGGGDNRGLHRIKPFYHAIEEIVDSIKIFWVVLSEEAGVIALKNFIDETGLSLDKFAVVMNHVRTQKNENFNFFRSELRTEILTAGGVELVMPGMSTKLSDWLRDNHIPMSDGGISFINRICIETYMNEMAKNLEKIGV